jgi:Na+/proline symporter
MELPTSETGKFRSDYLFPAIALQHQPFIVGVLFLLGITASTYASSDSALASLTTVFCLDFLNFDKREALGRPTKTLRTWVHVGFSVLLSIICIGLYYVNDSAVIQTLFKVASITYGPLLGLFAFGLLTKRTVNDKLAWLPCVLGPALSFLLDKYAPVLLNGYKFDFELLVVNGLLVFAGLWLLSNKTPGQTGGKL